MKPESDPSDPTDGSQASSRSMAIRIAKWLITVMVVVGLYFAVQSAVTQWKLEAGKVNAQIAEIERQLADTRDAGQRDQLRQSKQDLEATVPRLENLRWRRIALAALLYAFGMVPSSFFLHRALLALGERPRLRTTIAAQLFGHVGKYVPGKAMVIVLRAGVLSRDGVRPLPATICVFLETFLMMAVGATLAGVVVLFLPVPQWIALTAVCAAVLASLPTLPPILKRITVRVSKVSLTKVEAQIGLGLFATGWGCLLLSWLLIGASFACLITAIPSPKPLPAPIQLYAIALAAIGLAIVIGFASLLPGGAGVRELVLTTVLGVSIGTVHGLLAAIAARIMFLVVEVIVAGGSWLCLRKSA